MNLKNEVALVTGGSSGIGRGIAQNLIDSGAHVGFPDLLVFGRRRLGASAEAIGQQEADRVLNRVKRSTPKRKTIPIGAVQTTIRTV